MRPVKRYGVSKGKSARKFRSDSKSTAALNVRSSPMRGGWRL